MSKWLTDEQAQDYLQVSRATLLRWRQAGKLTAHKVGRAKLLRYRQEDLDALMLPETIGGAEQ